MNQTKFFQDPPGVAAAGGCLGLLLRWLLYLTGFDEKGILSSSNTLHLACLALAVAMGVYFLWTVRKSPEYSRDYPLLRRLCALAAGCLLLISGLSLYRQADAPLRLARCVLTLAAGAAMLLWAFPPEKGSNIAAALQGIICLAYTVDMLGRYQTWSGNPQLPDYCFHVLAGVSLCLTTYHALALYTGLSKPRHRNFWVLAALFLCPMCLVGPEGWVFYLSGTFWALSCLMTALPKEPEEIPEEEFDVPA